jgi:hypothetical protein
MAWLAQVMHCSKIAEAEAVVSVNEKKLLEMHMYMHVQLCTKIFGAPQVMQYPVAQLPQHGE